MSNLTRIERFVRHDAWTKSLDSFQGGQRLAVHILRLLHAVATDFRDRLLDARAAGLVFTTLLSLVPFLAVTLSVLKAFGVHLQLMPILAQVLEPLGSKGQEIIGRVINFVQNMKVGVLGAVGVAALFYTTYSLIAKIEDALNAIWRVREGRPLARKFTDYLSVVLVGPVLVFAAFAMTASLQSHWLVQTLLDIQPLGYVAVIAAQFLPFFMLCGFFTFLYKFVPNTQVRLSSAVVGGVTAGVMWQLAGWAFTAFVASSGKYSAIYSGFAVLILFLIWLSASWIIVLVGAQVAFFHQHPSAYQSYVLWRRGTHAFRERTVLSLLLKLTRRYLAGAAPVRLTELASDLDVPPAVVDDVVEELVQDGILGKVEEPKGVTLMKPPELIAMRQVFDVIERRAPALTEEGQSPKDPLLALLSRRDRAVDQALDGITLRTFAQDAEQAGREAGRPVYN